jgi:hypothetical protein
MGYQARVKESTDHKRAFWTKYQRQREPWGFDEILALIAADDAGMTVSEMSKWFGRTRTPILRALDELAGPDEWDYRFDLWP